MPNKTITLIILQADRQLWAGERVRLQVTDVSRGDLDVIYDERLTAGSHTVRMNLELPFDAGQVYGVSVEVKKHRAAWQLVNWRTFVRQTGGEPVEIDDHIMQLMLVPRQARSSDLEAGYRKLLDRGSPVVAAGTGLTEAAYLGLRDAAKMALLNIEAKLRSTRVGGVSLLPFIEGVRLVEVDRIFIYMRSEAKALVAAAGDFASARGHDAPENSPVALPAHPDSWKHKVFGAGNLQLSFSKDSEEMPGKPGTQVYSVDADIDLEKGLLHVYEYLDNKLLHPDQKTDQAQVYALLFSQRIFPDYTLDPLAG